jgi:hypothetical protein
VEVPYSTSIQWEGASPESKVELSATAGKAQAQATTEGFEAEADLDIAITSRRLLSYTVVTELEQGAPLAKAMAPLTLCIAGANDTAWTLAKRCRVKVEDLYKTNPEIAGGVFPGAKIVVLRK